MAKAYLLILFYAFAGNYHAITQERVFNDLKVCEWNGIAWVKELSQVPGNGQVFYFCAPFENNHGL